MENLTVAEFWQQQSFAFIETHSFNRGPKSVEEYERLSQEIAVIKEALASGRPMLRSKVNRRLRDLGEEIMGNKFDTVLSDSAMVSSSNTRKIGTLYPKSSAFERLTTLVRKADKQEAFSGCIPVYRDALVFHDAQGKQLRVLNICFECLRMVTDNKQLVEADFATYEALRVFLTELGHPIEPR